MPWNPADAERHTKRVEGKPHLAKLWSLVANRVLEHTGDEASAVRIASSVVKHHEENTGHEGRPEENEGPHDRIQHWSKK